jgi:hypothetical protein
LRHAAARGEATDEGAAGLGGGPATSRRRFPCSAEEELDVRTLVPPAGGDNPTLGTLLDQADAYRALGAEVLCLVAKSHGLPGAIMFFGVDEADAVLERFCACGVPSCWHAGTALSLSLHAIDPDDEEARVELAEIALRRWFWASPAGAPALLDATTTPPRIAHASGGGRAARRRGERGA